MERLFRAKIDDIRDLPAGGKNYQTQQKGYNQSAAEVPRRKMSIYNHERGVIQREQAPAVKQRSR